MKKCVLDVDFLGLWSEEKLGLISRHTHGCLESVIWSRNNKICSPKSRGSLAGKKSRTNTCHPYNQTCFTLLKRCQQLKHGQILTLDWMGCEWNLLNTLCKKVHHTSTTKINAHKKVKKSTIIQNPTFSNLKFLCSTTHHFGFGDCHSLVWNLDFEWLNFGICWLQLGVNAKDLLIIITSMNARRGFVFNL